jgi:hypothetical protein
VADSPIIRRTARSEEPLEFPLVFLAGKLQKEGLAIEITPESQPS